MLVGFLAGELARMRESQRGYRKPRAASATLLLESEHAMTTLLLIIAAILVIAGIVSLVRGQLLMGAVLIVVGLLVGPGGYSIFR